MTNMAPRVYQTRHVAILSFLSGILISFFFLFSFFGWFLKIVWLPGCWSNERNFEQGQPQSYLQFILAWWWSKVIGLDYKLLFCTLFESSWKIVWRPPPCINQHLHFFFFLQHSIFHRRYWHGNSSHRSFRCWATKLLVWVPMCTVSCSATEVE